MIVFNNITDEEHKEELKGMLLAHYKEYFGPEWSDKIPIKSIRDRLSSAKEGADHAIDLLYNKPNGNNVAFGIYDENTLIGTILLTVHVRKLSDEEEDIYGELYHLYIKPEYRKTFIEGTKKEEFIREVNSFVESYFKENEVSDILAAIPSEIDYLVECGKELGFEKKKDLPNGIGIQDALWEKHI